MPGRLYRCHQNAPKETVKTMSKERPNYKEEGEKQAGAELGQAQLKLGLDFSVDLVTQDLIC